jgi:acyl-CoA thioesterase
MNLVDNFTDPKTGELRQVYALQNGHSVTYVTPKGGKRKFFGSSDPDYKEPKKGQDPHEVATRNEISDEAAEDFRERQEEKREQEIRDQEHAIEKTMQNLRGDEDKPNVSPSLANALPPADPVTKEPLPAPKATPPKGKDK